MIIIYAHILLAFRVIVSAAVRAHFGDISAGRHPPTRTHKHESCARTPPPPPTSYSPRCRADPCCSGRFRTCPARQRCLRAAMSSCNPPSLCDRSQQICHDSARVAICGPTEERSATQQVQYTMVLARCVQPRAMFGGVRPRGTEPCGRAGQRRRKREPVAGCFCSMSVRRVDLVRFRCTAVVAQTRTVSVRGTMLFRQRTGTTTC